MFLRGVDISDPRVAADAVRARIGVVFQHYNLFPHLTVLDRVTLASRHVLRESRRTPKPAGVSCSSGSGSASSRRAIRTGSPAASSSARRSSGRSRPARELLLLDEVTSALDPELVGEVLDLVRQLKADGTTIVMATHEMSFARDVADRVVFLDAGLIAEEGPPAQVFGAPKNERTREFLRRVVSDRTGGRAAPGTPAPGIRTRDTASWYGHPGGQTLSHGHEAARLPCRGGRWAAQRRTVVARSAP